MKKNPLNNKNHFKKAFISVSNKEGLADFVRPLVKGGMSVLSTGGTARFLRSAGLSVVEVSEETGFSELMDGRVKTLHPRIYIPLLARLNHPGDEKVLAENKLSAFDLVVCNLYPFQEKIKVGAQDLVEWIDVGGPSLLRAGAKNFERITVLCDPADYQSILSAEKPPSLKDRKALAGKALSLLSDYDLHIAKWLLEEKQKLSKHAESLAYSPPVKTLDSVNNIFSSLSLSESQKKHDLYLKGRFFKDLRYGENPDQKALWVQCDKQGLHQAECLQGKKNLSFNNICDLDSAIRVLREFSEPCSVAVKHGNPCGVALGDKIEQASDRALKADPVSVFGAVLAVNRFVSEESAQILCSLFLSAVIAPDYSPSALELFKSKRKNLCLMKWPEMTLKNQDPIKIRSVEGGWLAQEDQKIVEKWPSTWKCVTDNIPDTTLRSELLMAWKICVHLKSNAIALVSDKQTLGLGMGEVNRVSAVEQAIQRWKKFHPHILPVLASDGFFPFSDSIEKAGEAGIKWIIQPGGSLRDQEVFSTAKALSLNMVITGQRCFSH